MSFSAFAAEKSVTVKSANNLFESFARSAVQGDTFDIVIRLRSDLMIVDGTVELGFDSSILRVTGVSNGRITASQSNITEDRQLSENSVITVFSSGAGSYDFTAEDTLLTYSFVVSGKLSGNKEITVDFKNLTANRTFVNDKGNVEITVDGDVPLISKSAVKTDGFSVGAAVTPVKGDVNLDQTVDINDVTLLQLALVEKAELTDAQKSLSEVYHDGKISIRDVTFIQMFLAGMREFL